VKQFRYAYKPVGKTARRDIFFANVLKLFIYKTRNSRF
jgi:hypothetical protein